jgi:hypothetical protein
MLTIYEASAHEYHISFNVAKTKCLIVSPNYHRMSLQQADIYQFHIINPPIEFVKSLVHLGHIITSTVTDDEDLIQSENNFITQFNNMASYFKELGLVLRLQTFHCLLHQFLCLWVMVIIKSMHRGNVPGMEKEPSGHMEITLSHTLQSATDNHSMFTFV